MANGDDMIHFESEMTAFLRQEAIFANAIGPFPNQLKKLFVHALIFHGKDFKAFATLAASKSRKRPIRR
jgi:hypothetical protein